jgi:hypothetical protein
MLHHHYLSESFKSFGPPTHLTVFSTGVEVKPAETTRREQDTNDTTDSKAPNRF